MKTFVQYVESLFDIKTVNTVGDLRTEVPRSLRIFINPTLQEISSIQRTSEVGGILVGDDVYIWPRRLAGHKMMAGLLGISQADANFELEVLGPMLTVNMSTSYESKIRDPEAKRQMEDRIKQLILSKQT